MHSKSVHSNSGQLVTTDTSVLVKVKVKCTLVQALRPCTGRTAYRGNRGIALLFHDNGTIRGVRGQRHGPTALYLRERPDTHCRGG